MSFEDWISTVANVIVGLLLGMAVANLLKLMLAGAWVFVTILIVFGAVMAGIYLLNVRLSDWVLGIGTRNAPKTTRRPTPFMRRLSLPAGWGLGAALDVLGLGQPLLDWIAS